MQRFLFGVHRSEQHNVSAPPSLGQDSAQRITPRKVKDPEALLACIDRTLNGRRRSARPDPRERSCACGTPIAVDHRSHSSAKNDYDISLLIFYTHMRDDWTARSVRGCDMMITKASGYDSLSQLQPLPSRCASPAAAFEVREDRVGHTGYDWARRSRQRKAQKQKASSRLIPRTVKD